EKMEVEREGRERERNVSGFCLEKNVTKKIAKRKQPGLAAQAWYLSYSGVGEGQEDRKTQGLLGLQSRFSAGLEHRQQLLQK
ncbi:hypothetical protein ACQP3J_33895, partial [Escherichia coli]